MPSIPNIKICAGCSGLIEEGVLLSGNTFGADFYTDGKMEAPMLPEQHALFKCPHCQSLMWSDDLQLIDPDALDEQANIMPYLVPNFDEYLHKLKDGDIDKEEYLRVKAWHTGNDQRRKNNTRKKLSIDEIANLNALERVLGSSDNDIVYKAEIKRELSLFGESIDLLKGFNDFSMDIVHTIRRLSLERVVFVSPIDEYCEEAYDDEVKKSEGYKVGNKKYGSWIEYYPNGNKERENNYLDGNPVGIESTWYKNGQKKSENICASHPNNNLYECDERKITKYFESGGVKSITENWMGEGLSGLCTWFYENGQTKEQSFYAFGAKAGPCIKYYKNGLKKIEKTYKAFLYEDVHPYTDESQFYMVSFKDGMTVLYRKNGVKKLELNYKHVFDVYSDSLVNHKSMKDGLCTRWTEDGEKVKTRYVAYYANYCIDPPGRVTGADCDF